MVASQFPTSPDVTGAAAALDGITASPAPSASLDVAQGGTATPAAPRHGGNLGEAVLRYGRPRDTWLDLSTGINPHGYPVGTLPPHVWRDLPDTHDDLRHAAARYYGTDVANVVPCAGSQAVIRLLPTLLRPGRVAIASLTYSEYAPAFVRAGHTVVPWLGPDAPLPDDIDHIVCVNPDNPTATRATPDTLRMWHRQVSARNGLLLVDEAFADASPAGSIATHAGMPGLVILRSVGKFFGLAGLRAGFALCEPALAQTLTQALGAWTVNGPARFVVQAALADVAWQTATRASLHAQGERLLAMLHAHDWPARGTPLFAWTPHALAPQWHEALAAQGVWTRLFDPRPVAPHGEVLPSLRIGLPATETEWQRLDHTLSTLPQ